MRPVSLVIEDLQWVDDGNGRGPNGRTGRNACAWESSLHEGVMHTSSFSGHLAYRSTVPPSFASHGSDLENDDADGREVACGRASVRHGGKKLDVLTWQIRHDATLRHQICPPSCTCSALLSQIPSDAPFSIDVMLAMHSAAPPVYRVNVKHSMPPY